MLELSDALWSYNDIITEVCNVNMYSSAPVNLHNSCWRNLLHALHVWYTEQAKKYSQSLRWLCLLENHIFCPIPLLHTCSPAPCTSWSALPPQPFCSSWEFLWLLQFYNSCNLMFKAEERCGWWPPSQINVYINMVASHPLWSSMLQILG